ncbi:MAG: hypothetical protein PWQ82_1768 [Thermosediminibacterales bacterium]|nr:hypothetical protein [Thermosediminibacterales bacterium]MDK2836161.1 hypothetical protein [Thermosediminibacterales bacterium]
MFPLVDVVIMILKSIPQVILNPLLWVVVFIVYMQFKRVSKMEEKLFGQAINSPREQTIQASLYGILGGIIGSFLLVFVGVSIANIGLGYVWILAIMLMMIHPRFMCFSYAGGIVSISSLLFGYPKIDVPGLMAIVAILHFVEGVLIYFSGAKGAAPIFVKDSRYGSVGGFTLQKFWPVPVVILLAITGQEIPKESIQMPDWWPLIKPPEELLNNENLLYVMFPVVAGLGYGDMVVSRTPEEKSKKSARYLFVFSTLLLILSVLASRMHVFKYAAALFSPLAHDYVIYLGRSAEKKGRPIYTAPQTGQMVLDVLPGSPAEKMGIKSRDIILAINGNRIVCKEDLRQFLSSYPPFIWVDGIHADGERFSYEYRDYVNGIGSLGTILVPAEGESTVVINEAHSGILLRYLKKLYEKVFKKT